MKKKHNVLLYGLYAILIIACTACAPKNNKDETITIEFEQNLLTFEELVAHSNSAIVGEYIETIKHDNYIEQKFKVIECLYGDVTDKEIYLYSNLGVAHVNQINYTYEPGEDKYEVGDKYILVMEKITYIMYEHDRYMLSADVFMSETDKEYSMYSQPIDIPAKTSIKDYICAIYNSVPHPTIQDTVVSYKNDIEEMVGESPFVGVVKILGLANEGLVHNGNVYKCSVESLLKGKTLNTYEDGTILLVIQKNKVDINKEYIIGFYPADENSLIYTQTTLNSIHDVNNELLETIAAILTQ